MGAGKRRRAADAPVPPPEQEPCADVATESPPDGSAAGAPPGEVAAPPPGPALETRNEVVLVGRVAAPAEERTLPSGDVLVAWRVVVERPRDGRPLPPGVRVSTVDTLNCVAWRAGPRRTALRLVAGDVVQVQGALRRRFWRAGGGPVSLCEVEVAALTRLTEAKG